ncbi:hypothetical protein D3C73_628590 [compost metagenome]
MNSVKILDCMYRIQTQRIDMKVFKPHAYIVQYQIPLSMTIAIVVIQRITPGRMVFVGKIWTIIREIVSLWTEMIIDDIQNYRNIGLMTGIHKPLEFRSATIGMLNCKRKNAIVAPISFTGKLCNRHNFNSSDPQIFQIGNLFDNTIKIMG